MVRESRSNSEGVFIVGKKRTDADMDQKTKKPGNEIVQCPHCGHRCKAKRLSRHIAHSCSG